MWAQNSLQFQPEVPSSEITECSCSYVFKVQSQYNVKAS